MLSMFLFFYLYLKNKMHNSTYDTNFKHVSRQTQERLLTIHD